MAVIHILKDGTRLDDISGHVVRMEDAEELYRLIDSISQRRGERDKDGKS